MLPKGGPIEHIPINVEDAARDAEAVGTAQRYKETLIALNAEFKTHHYSIIDAVDDEDILAAEQEVLDEHDNIVKVLTSQLQRIIKSNLPAASAGARDIQSRKLSHLGQALELVGTEIQSIPEDSDDTYLLQQYSDRLDEFKA